MTFISNPSIYRSPAALVGRRREMADVDRLLDRASLGSGAVLVFHGPHGSGKTALTDAASELARRKGFEVLRAAPARGQPGRLVWAQLLRAIGGQSAWLLGCSTSHRFWNWTASHWSSLAATDASW